MGLLLACGLVVGMVGGCATTDKREVSPSEEVAQVYCIYDLDPFRSFDAEGDLNVEGFHVTVVLWSARTHRGIAADGTLRTRLYRVDRVPGEKTVRTLVREWTVDTSGLKTFASSMLGEGYKLEYRWAPEDEVGREIQVVTSFETPRGRIVHSQTKSIRLPKD